MLSPKRNPYRGFRRNRTVQELERISEAYYYDIIISSAELKKLILRRIKELDVDLKLVLEEAGVTHHAFNTKYLREKDPVSTPKLRQSHIMSILEVLGIDTQILFVVKNKDDVPTSHLKYKEKYNES